MSDPSNASDQGSLWDFACRFYQVPGVEADCLTVQDQHGLDVVLLIFALYRARLGHGFDAVEAYGLARSLMAQLVDPLRRHRRALKQDPGPYALPMVKALRAQLLAAELAGEQTILQRLHSIRIKGSAISSEEALTACVRAADVHLDAALDAVLKRLADAAHRV